MQLIDTIIIGAGPTGLSVGYWLDYYGLEYRILEKKTVGSSWAATYTCLELLTPESYISIPCWERDPGDKYLTASRFLQKLQNYAEQKYNLAIQSDTDVRALFYTDAGICVVMRDSSIYCKNLVLAMGRCARPFIPSYLQDIMKGGIHSSEYRSPVPYRDQDVLIFGGSNSAVDIAIDLCGIARTITIYSRSGLNIIPLVRGGILSHAVSRVAEFTLFRAFSWMMLSIWRLYSARYCYGAINWFSDPARYPVPKPEILELIRAKKIVVQKGAMQLTKNIKQADQLKAIFATGYTNEIAAMVAHLSVDLDFNRPCIVKRYANGSSLSIIGAAHSPGTIWLSKVGKLALKVVLGIRRLKKRGLVNSVVLISGTF